MKKQSSRSAERRYNALLKRGTKVRSCPSSESAMAATRAISGMADVQGVVNRGGAVDSDFLAGLRASGIASPVAPAEKVAEEVRVCRQKRVLAAILGGAMVVTGLWLGYSSGGFSSGAYEVEGTLLLDRAQLPGVRIVFRPGDGKPSLSAVSGPMGQFRIKVPEGDYAVFFEDEEANRTPEAYCSAETTPFQLHVDKPLENLQFFAVTQARR